MNTLSRNALTLIELVVVLAILTALAGVAVKSLEPVADQARYETTAKTLRALDQAIINQTLRSDSVAVIDGFVADVGRLPIARDDSNGSGLVVAEELWRLEDWDGNSTIDIEPFSISNFDDPHTAVNEESDAVSMTSPIVERISVSAGWRGPYVELPANGQALLDGYGRTFRLLNALGADASANDSIVQIDSLGADAVVGASTTYGVDQTLPLGDLSSRWQGQLRFRIRQLNTTTGAVSDPNISATQKLVIRVYGPDSAARSIAGTLVNETIYDGTTSGAITALPAAHTTVPLACGVRAVRAVLVSGTSPNEIVEHSSGLHYITVLPSAQPTYELVLRL